MQTSGMEDAPRRLKSARKGAAFRTAAEAAIKMNVPTPTYVAHENGRRQFGENSAQLYGKTFGVDPYWLMTGKMPDKRGGESSDGETIPEYDLRGDLPSGDLLTSKLRSSLPPGSVLGRWQMPSVYLEGRLGMRADEAVVLICVDDSMFDYQNPGAPGTIQPGDRVVVDVSDQRPSPPGAFAIHDGTGILFKVLEVLPGTGPAKLRVSSRNPNYTSYEAPLADLKILGRAKAKISQL